VKGSLVAALFVSVTEAPPGARETIQKILEHARDPVDVELSHQLRVIAAQQPRPSLQLAWHYLQRTSHEVAA
jgi:hypothetical protein